MWKFRLRSLAEKTAQRASNGLKPRLSGSKVYPLGVYTLPQFHLEGAMRSAVQGSSPDCTTYKPGHCMICLIPLKFHILHLKRGQSYLSQKVEGSLASLKPGGHSTESPAPCWPLGTLKLFLPLRFLHSLNSFGPPNFAHNTFLKMHL